MQHNSIKNEGAIAIAKALKSNKSLQKLDLWVRILFTSK